MQQSDENTSLEIPDTWDETAYLNANSDVKIAVSSGKISSGYMHFITWGIFERRTAFWLSELTNSDAIWPWSDWQYISNNRDIWHDLLKLTPMQHYHSKGKAEGRKTGLEESFDRFHEQSGAPTWAIQEMLKQSYFDPGLDLASFTNFSHYNPFSRSEYAKLFTKISDQLKYSEYDFIFLLPWIKKGGADLAALFHIEAASKRYEKIAVITGENSDSEWSDQLPENVNFIEFGKIFFDTPMDIQIRLYYHLIAALRPKAIHIINNHAAWLLLKTHPQAVSSLTKVYASLYCYDQNNYGEPVGYARLIRNSISGIHRIFTDNSAFSKHLTKTFGVPEERITILKHPVRTEGHFKIKANYSNKVLWASRLDSQKRPEMLIEIAKQLPGLSFCVYGDAVLGKQEKIVAALNSVENITYCGSFNDIDELIWDNYLCFLYTSAWDGLPNIVLEMLSVGILVVAPKIGGLGEDLTSEHLILVEEDLPSAFSSAIESIIKDPLRASDLRNNGQKFVQKYHNRDNFNRSLTECGYLQLDRDAVDVSSQNAGDRII